jgi:Carboxypeptidase regulatory-like domain
MPLPQAAPSGLHRTFLSCSSLRPLVLLALALLALAPAGLAQYRASIQGTVTDPTGAVIPGATVTLTDLQTNQVQTSISNDSGVYTFNALAPDHYSIVVERAGFQKKVLSDVQIIPEQANSVNVQMLVGEATQTVTVSANTTPLLDTETATISGTISSNEIQHLPSFGRDTFQLAQLAPGTFGDASQNSGGGSYSLPGSNTAASGSSDGIFKTENGPQIVADGGQNNSNGISIDGISTASAVWGGTTVITPSEDSIATMKVVSNSYDAENGRFSAAQIQVISKSGTNVVHGSAFFMGERPGLNAYQAWNGPGSVGPGTPAARGLLKDTSRFNQYGGSLGGPFWKNHIFGFFDYETLRNNTAVTGVGWYDTPQFDKLAPANSIASEFLTIPGAQVASIGQIAVNCATAGLVEGKNCRTESGGLNIGTPLTTGLGKQDPTYVSSGSPGLGSGLGTTPDIAEYTTSNPLSTTEDQYNGRIDDNVSANDRASFTIYWVPVQTTDYNGPIRAYNLYHHSAINDAFTALWDHTFSPTWFNEARANAAGWRWNEISTNPQEPFGLPSDTVSQIGALNGSTSSLAFNYFGAPGPSVFNQWTYGYQDVVTKIAGNHNIKFGGGVTRLYYLNEASYAARPSFMFFNIWDFLNDAPEAEGGTFDPLTGVPTSNRQDDREDLWGFFVQDDYKIRPSLTLNLGLRYTYNGSLASKEGNLSVAQTGAGSGLFSGLRLKVGGPLYQPQKMNFGPEVGFAWSPPHDNGKVVVRGGFGLNYDEEEIAIAANGINNPPSVVTPNFSSPSPASISPDIVYQVPSDVHTLFGYPPNPHTIVSYNSNNLPTTGETAVTGFPSNLPTAYLYHYSLDAEYNFAGNWVATLGYQGSTGRHLITQYNQNVIGAADGVALNPAVNSFDYYGNEGFSDYNAMLATLKHSFSQQFTADVEYTWARSMDTGSQPYYEDPYPFNPHLAYGRSDFNVTDAAKIYGLWEPVFHHGGQDFLDKVVGGWSVSGILNLHTGFPWTPVYSSITNGNLYYSGSGYGTLRPAAYLGGAGHGTSNRSFESSLGQPNLDFPNGGLAYFTVPTYPVVTAPFPGTVGAPQAPGVARNSLNGPNYRDLDGTISKNFGLPKMPVLGENAGVEIRFDAFNLFNTTNLNVGSITNSITASNFGQATAALGSRMLDFQARFSF